MLPLAFFNEVCGCCMQMGGRIACGAVYNMKGTSGKVPVSWYAMHAAASSVLYRHRSGFCTSAMSMSILLQQHMRHSFGGLIAWWGWVSEVACPWSSGGH